MREFSQVQISILLCLIRSSGTHALKKYARLDNISKLFMLLQLAVGLMVENVANRINEARKSRGSNPYIHLRASMLSGLL